MVLGLFTVVIMGVVAYAFWREGPLTAFAMCVNVVLAGALAFNYFEPIADLLESSFEDTFANTHMEYPPVLYRGGAVVFGLVTGYLLSGFLVCVLQTLPLQQNFLSF